MTIEEQDIDGCFVVRKKRYSDDRGFCQEVFTNKPVVKERDNWQQMLWYSGEKHSLRGLYWCGYGRLINAIAGKAFLAVVDLRPKTKTHKKWISVWLTPEENTQVYIPPMCAHGIYFAEDNTSVLCLQEAIYHANADQVIHFEDPTFDVKWPKAKKYIMSEKDRTAKLFDHLK